MIGLRKELILKMLCYAQLLLLASGWFTPIQAAPFDIDKSHTAVYFAGSHFDRSLVRGRFGKVISTIDFDENLKTGNVNLAVDVTSLSTGQSLLDSVLKSGQFFEAEKFPDIYFQSSQFVFVGDQLKAVTGQLTLHGVTKSVSLQAERFSCGVVRLFGAARYVCGGDFSLGILRSDFGMTQFLPEVGDRVAIQIAVEATPR